jgi:hypothetical protein
MFFSPSSRRIETVGCFLSCLSKPIGMVARCDVHRSDQQMETDVCGRDGLGLLRYFPLATNGTCTGVTDA